MTAETMYQLEDGLSEAAFKECADQGQKVLIICVEAPTPARGNFRGGWQLFAFNPNTGKWAPLNLFRPKGGIHSRRVVRTINGLCRLLKDLGFPVAVVPFGIGSGVETSKSGDLRYINDMDCI